MSRRRIVPFVVAVLLLLVVPTVTPAAAYLRTVSWNARHMGWSGETNWSAYAAQVWNQYGSTSTSSNGCDVIFLQEVMYASSATSFASALSSLSGVTWVAVTTPAIGRTSYKECYSVVYRTDRVYNVTSSVYNDVGDKFEREPQIVTLKQTGTGADFTFINWHTIWGTAAQRDQEIKDIVAVFNAVQNASSSDQDVILLGDFNRPATHAAFNNLKSTSYVSPVVTFKVNDNTTLNSSCAFANPYDHFFYQAAYLTEYSASGRDYIANMCTFYGYSDHAPIWLRLYASSDTD